MSVAAWGGNLPGMGQARWLLASDKARNMPLTCRACSGNELGPPLQFPKRTEMSARATEPLDATNGLPYSSNQQVAIFHFYSRSPQ
jgi:hypothetical protein